MAALFAEIVAGIDCTQSAGIGGRRGRRDLGRGVEVLDDQAGQAFGQAASGLAVAGGEHAQIQGGHGGHAGVERQGRALQPKIGEAAGQASLHQAQGPAVQPRRSAHQHGALGLDGGRAIDGRAVQGSTVQQQAHIAGHVAGRGGGRLGRGRLAAIGERARLQLQARPAIALGETSGQGGGQGRGQSGHGGARLAERSVV